MNRLRHTIFLVFVCACLPSIIHGQEDRLTKLMTLGENARTSEIWEMAEIHFRDALELTNVSEESAAEISIRLAEVLIRGGKPDEALIALDAPAVARRMDRDFWRAQATAALGKMAEAAAMFAIQFNHPTAPHRVEAGFSLAGLQRAMGKNEQALLTLSTLQQITNPQASARARLSKVEILLLLNQLDEARKQFPPRAEIASSDRPLADFLEAYLLLAEKQWAASQKLFESIAAAPQMNLPARHHQAVLGLADALAGQGLTEEAAVKLLDFIQKFPDSPQLAEFFERIRRGMPEKPALSDATLARIMQWIPAEESTDHSWLLGMESGESVANASWTTQPDLSELAVQAIFTRAFGMHRVGLPEAQAEALHLLNVLRLEAPAHPLSLTALDLKAKWKKQQGDTQAAAILLEILRDATDTPQVRGEAAFDAGRTAYQEANYEQAASLFGQAAAELNAQSANAAQINAIAAQIANRTFSQIMLISAPIPIEPSQAENLTLDAALVINDSALRVSALAEFIEKNPNHARLDEARVAQAESMLDSPQPDLAAANSLLDQMPAESALTDRVMFARLRILDHRGDLALAAQQAQAIIEKYPDSALANEASMILGRNLFDAKDYNAARLVFEKVAATQQDAVRSQAAWLLAARSAALVGTQASKEEAVALFDSAIARDPQLAAAAMLEKADHLIKNLYRFSDAANFLQPWFEKLAVGDPLRMPVGFLLGQAFYAQGAEREGSLAQALSIYDLLLKDLKNIDPMMHRLQYLRGLVLEQLPDPKNPAIKREEEAFAAFYSALEISEPPADWEYFELCGFKALSMLEKSQRWPAAIATAKKIASFKGPRAAEAAARADQLQLKYQVWED